MPKISKETATHQVFPGYTDSYEGESGGWTVDFDSYSTEMDLAPFFKGAPDDLCQAHHMGYVIRGRFGVRRADGVEEIYEAGEAFVIEPGHIPLVFDGGEYVAFTPTEEAKEQAAVMMPNVMKFAQEQGIEIPAQMTAPATS